MPEWPTEETQLTIPVFVPGDSFLVFSRAGSAHVYRVGLTGKLLPIAGPPTGDKDSD